MHCPSLRFYISLCSRKLEVSPLKICLHQTRGKIVCMQKQRFTYKTALQTYVLQCEYFRILRACRLERGSDHIWNVGIKSYICIISKYIWVNRFLKRGEGWFFALKILNFYTHCKDYHYFCTWRDCVSVILCDPPYAEIATRCLTFILLIMLKILSFL